MFLRFELAHEIEFSFVLSRIVEEFRIVIRCSGDVDEIRKLIANEMLYLSCNLEISNLLPYDFVLDIIECLHVFDVSLLAVFSDYSEIGLSLFFKLSNCLEHDLQIERRFLLVLLSP